MMRIKATIFYTCDSEHPDREYIPDWTEDKVLKFSDTYDIKEGSFWGEDDLIAYIKNDLKLIAGGGYSSKHIHNVSFEMKRV